MVRDAFEGSLTNAPPSTPPVSHQTIHESTVAKLGVTRSSMWPPSKNHRILVAEKYESRTSPVVARTIGVSPRASNSWQ